MSDESIIKTINTDRAAPVFIDNIKKELSSQTDDFINFLVDKKVMTVGIGLILASQLSVFVNIMTTSIINPILHKIIKQNKDKKLEELKVKWYGVDFEIGKVISGLINFSFILIVLYVVYKIEVKLTKHVNGKNNSS